MQLIGWTRVQCICDPLLCSSSLIIQRICLRGFVGSKVQKFYCNSSDFIFNSSGSIQSNLINIAVYSRYVCRSTFSSSFEIQNSLHRNHIHDQHQLLQSDATTIKVCRYVINEMCIKHENTNSFNTEHVNSSSTIWNSNENPLVLVQQISLDDWCIFITQANTTATTTATKSCR